MKEITIVGRGDSWRECLFNTEEIWGTATCLTTEGLKDKPFTKVFAFDPVYPDFQKALDIAKERNIPVVSTLFYATEQYPSREVVREFRVSYFKTTISYMLAMAIYQKPDRMWVYGCEQTKTLNYVLFKPFVTFWLGAAYARGIDMRLGRGVLNWQYASLPLRQFLDDEGMKELEKELGYKING